MSKHTPGSWKVFESDVTGLSVNSEGRRVCDVKLHPQGEDRANAELIASAPELKSQLTDLRKRYDEMRAEMITALNGALVVLLLGEHVNKEEAVSYLKELTSKYSPQPTGAVKGEKPPEDQY